MNPVILKIHEWGTESVIEEYLAGHGKKELDQR